MSRGFMGTTRKPRRSVVTVQTFNIPEAKKSQARAEQSQSDVAFFFTPVDWCITSTHHKAKTLTKNTTWKSLVTFVMLCGARDRTCGQREHGSCIMTMHQLIPHNWFKLSWPNTTFLWFNRLPALPTGSLPSRHGFLRLLAVPPPENTAGKDSIWVTRRHNTEHNGQAVLHLQRGIPEMLQTMAELLGEVCSVTRRLLRRGLGLQTSGHVNVFFQAKGWILFEQPSYCRDSSWLQWCWTASWNWSLSYGSSSGRSARPSV